MSCKCLLFGYKSTLIFKLKFEFFKQKKEAAIKIATSQPFFIT